MPLREDLLAAKSEALARFGVARTAADVEVVRVAFLGRSGRLRDLQKEFSAAPPDEKRQLGPLFNEAKAAIEQAWEAARRSVVLVEADEPIDLTVPLAERRLGSIHPLSQIATEVERVFEGMGYAVVDGPHIDFDEFNFSRLNIPADHPARDLQDTFWLKSPAWKEPKLLRTHTSTVQSRTYCTVKPPFRRVAIGKVFRYEAVDATHDNTFTQVEGFVVDQEITVAHMVGTIRAMLAGVLRRGDLEVRLRPGYFPFVEPGFEVDMRSPSAEPGSRLASWVELMGCGMIHPKVLEAGGIDPAQWQGFAFGMGLERLAMMRHSIGDIRVFNSADLRSLRQFGS